MKTPEELRREADRIEQEDKEKRHKKRIQDREDFEKNTGIRVYTSDDYCGLEIKGISFYYGYEETMCPKHKNQEECEDKDCYDAEWCFVAKNNGKEVTRIPQSKLHPEQNEEPFWYLLAGIGHYLS